MSSLKKIYLYILVFILIYVEFGYQMVVTAVLPGTGRMLIILIAVVPLIFMIKEVRPSSIFLFLYLFLIIAFSAFRDESLKNSILLLIPIFIGFIIANSVSFIEVARIFSSVVVFLAAYSLITFFISLIWPSFIVSLPYLGHVYDSKASIYNAFFSVCISNSETVRNYGITWEPGAFAILLCLSLYVLLNYSNEVNKFSVFVVIVSIITTFSTMGYFAMAGILLAVLFKHKKGNGKVKLYVALFSLILVVAFFTAPKSISDIVFRKLDGLFSDGKDIAYTTQARLNAIIYPLEAFFSSPFLGVGYEQFTIINKTLCDGTATNTIINWFAILGLTLGIPCTVGYIKFVLINVKMASLSVFSAILLIIVSILLVSTESLLRISLIYILIFYAFSMSKSFDNGGSHENSFFVRDVLS